MKYIRTLTALSTIAFTLVLSLVAFNSSESYAQNNTINGSNQSSSSTTNDTAASSNQSDSGNISAFAGRAL
jgi:hypothetical protein